MGKLTKEGINSFKFFLAYSGSLAVDDAQLIHGFRRSKELGALPIVSCQLSSSFPVFLLYLADHAAFKSPYLLWRYRSTARMLQPCWMRSRGPLIVVSPALRATTSPDQPCLRCAAATRLLPATTLPFSASTATEGCLKITHYTVRLAQLAGAGINTEHCAHGWFGLCLDRASPTRGRISAAFRAQLGCMRTFPLGRNVNDNKDKNTHFGALFELGAAFCCAG